MIYVGYCAFATVLGFLLGASNTPVVGAFLTALIGLIGTVVTATKLAGESHGTTNIGSFVGKTLTVFAVGILIGELGGEAHRQQWFQNQNRTLPWGSFSPPSNTYEAIDWIVLKERMLAIGYTSEDVERLYEIRLKERGRLEKKAAAEEEANVDAYERTSVYDATSPFSQLLEKSASSKQTQGRGPASTP